MSEKTTVNCPAAPKAIGPYSQAVKVGNHVFISGQIALNPETGEMVGNDVPSQTRQVLENLMAIVDFVGGSAAAIVKTTVYMTDLGEFQAMNQVYAEYFPFEPPARACVQVQALPKGALVEIEAIAMLPETSFGSGALM